MIDGFEAITESVTPYEKEMIIPALVAGLKARVGAKLAIRNRMNGESIKIVIRRYGKTQTAVAKIIGESPQNLGSMLEARDVKSSLVERIAAALNISIGELYGEANMPISSASASGQSAAIVGNGNNLNANEARLLGLLEEKDRQIAKQQSQISKLLDMLAAK